MQQAATEAGPGGSSAIETAETKSNTLILTWTNGTATPVDQDVKFAYKGLNDTMHVTVKLAGK